MAEGVWRALVRNSIRRGQGDTHYALTFAGDVSKAFDRVQRNMLAWGALDFGFPQWVLRLSLPSYVWKRCLVDGIVASDELFQVAGIAPGAAFAT